MLPKKPLTITPEAGDAADALWERLNTVAPDKYRVGVGLKQIGKEYTDQLALFVHVREKKSLSEVPEPERVPPEFSGYITDVVQVQPTLLQDETRYDPLRGGIQIMREPIPADLALAPASGTWGAMVRNRKTGVLQGLTCAHVVDQIGLKVFQASYVPASPEGNLVGTVSDLRDQVGPVFLDCAVLDLTGPRSALTTVEGIGPIQGVSTAVPNPGEMVKKRGARTLLTDGFFVRARRSLGTSPSYDQYDITGGVPFVTVFAGPGDSGSVILNGNNEVIALLHAAPFIDLPDGLSSHGCAMPIHNVQESLQIDIAT